jgi:LemA protein
MVWIVVAVIVVVLVLLLVGIYNKLVKLRNRVEQAWSQIDVMLKRRHDLIPNLIETVKGYAKHEKETLEAVIQARNSAVAVSSSSGNAGAAGEAEGFLSQALGKLFALSESYPDLKANTNFLQLQEELTATEDKISYSRQFYNDAVVKYQNATETFPSNIFANMFNFEDKEFFKIENEGEKSVPKVQF